MKKIQVVAAIIKNQNRILCCQREANKLTYLSEKWEFPGGKLEEGESNKEGLIREIKEELEMDIYNLEFALTVQHQYPNFHLTMHTYFADTKQINHELHAHKKATWESIENLDKFDWAAADIPIVEYLKKNL